MIQAGKLNAYLADAYSVKPAETWKFVVPGLKNEFQGGAGGRQTKILNFGVIKLCKLVLYNALLFM